MEWSWDDSWPDIDRLSDAERRRLLRDLERQERTISARRRRLHRKIDALRAELVRRIRTGEIDVVTGPWRDRASRVFAGTGRLPEESSALPADLCTLSPATLRRLHGDLDREEDDVSLRRRVLHFRIDLLRWIEGLGSIN
jgi:hypothetical protein